MISLSDTSPGILMVSAYSGLKLCFLHSFKKRFLALFSALRLVLILAEKAAVQRISLVISYSIS